MNFELVTLKEFTVGEPTAAEAPAFNQKYATVFEDDGQTAYFYALNMENKEMPIADALHIYNLDNVTDKNIPSKVQIVWAKDNSVSILYINGYTHAVYNFDEEYGFCRNNFPPPAQNGGWSVNGHEWDQKYFEKLVSES